MNNNKPKIVVLGAGYAGLMTAKRVTKILDPEEADLVLVNKHNYHYETILVYYVADVTIYLNHVSFIISDAISLNCVCFIYDSVVKVEKQDKRVILDNGEITYDYLVMALGFKSNTFGIKGMEENALS